MPDPAAPPVPGAYWLADGTVLAGEYPGAADEDEGRAKLSMFLDAGIRTFIDLTEAREPLEPYAAMLRELAAARGIAVRHLRFPIRDASLPASPALMAEILATMRREVAAGRPVYVHCWGGIGRTGTVAGCWLVDAGLDGPAAMARLAELRAGTPDAATRSPETDAQHRFVLAWVPVTASSSGGRTPPGRSSRTATGSGTSGCR